MLINRRNRPDHSARGRSRRTALRTAAWESLEERICMSTIVATWDGSAGDGKWSTAANWDVDLVPRNDGINNFDVVIPDGKTVNFNRPAETFDIDSLTLGGTLGTAQLNVVAGTLEVINQAALAGILNGQGGHFTSTSNPATQAQFAGNKARVWASNGSQITIDAPAYDGRGLVDQNFIIFSASGAGSRLNFDRLLSLNDGFTDLNQSVTHSITASGGGVIDLSGMTDLYGPTGTIDPNLLSLSANTGGELWLDSLTSVAGPNANPIRITLNNGTLRLGDFRTSQRIDLTLNDPADHVIGVASLHLDPLVHFTAPNGGRLSVAGDLEYAHSAETDLALGKVIVRADGIGRAVEAGGIDVNINAGILSNDNFGYAQLIVGNGSYIRLLDEIDNGNSQGLRAESLYLFGELKLASLGQDALRIGAGGVLDIGQLNIYAMIDRDAAGNLDGVRQLINLRDLFPAGVNQIVFDGGVIVRTPAPNTSRMLVSLRGGKVQEFEWPKGLYTGQFNQAGSADGFMTWGTDPSYPGQRVLFATSRAGDTILEYDGTGALLRTIGSITDPEGIVDGPGGFLYVVSNGTDQVYRVDKATGAKTQLGDLNASINTPGEMVLGPDGNLYLAEYDRDEVLRIAPATGALVGTQITGLSGPWGLEFGPDQMLYVGNFDADNVQRIDVATNTASMFAGEIDGAASMAFGPDGNVYVLAFNVDKVFRFTADGTLLYSTAYLPSASSGTFDFDRPNDILFEHADVPQPYVPHPDSVSISVVTPDAATNPHAHTFATVSIQFPTSGFQVEWGSAYFDGSAFVVNTQVRQTSQMVLQVITRLTHTYDLGDLSAMPAGGVFSFQAWGIPVKSVAFVNPLPEIVVSGKGQEIVSGDGTPTETDGTDFGSVPVGSNAASTFLVSNIGTRALEISSVAIPLGFAPGETLNGVIPAGGADTFTIALDTSTPGPRTGDVIIANSDPDEGVYTFTITGEATIAVGSISGTKYRDINGNGRRDANLIIGDPPDVVFVIDVSGSTADVFLGTINVGDVNGDGAQNTVLDAEIAGYLVLLDQVIAAGRGNEVNIALVPFGSGAAALDLDPAAAGTQNWAHPLDDKDGNGVPDVKQRLLGLRASGSTNFAAALVEARRVLVDKGTKVDDANVVFISDGEPTTGGEFTDDVVLLKQVCPRVHAFGAGTGAKIATLRLIDDEAVIFDDPQDLKDVFQIGGGGGTREYVEPGMGGIKIYLDLNNDGDHDANEPFQITSADDPATPKIDEGGAYRFDNLTPGSYVVREEVPAGYVITQPTQGYYSITLDAGENSIDNNFGNHLAGLTIDFEPPPGGTLTLARGETIKLTVSVQGPAWLGGWQLDFSRSDIAAGQLELDNWIPNTAAWPQILDGHLDLPGDQFVAGGRSDFIDASGKVTLGTFDLTAPMVNTDTTFVLSVQSLRPGPFATAFTDALGAVGVANYGTINVMVRGDASAPTVQSIEVNAGLTDAANLPGKGPQPSPAGWKPQRSQISNVRITFSEEMRGITAADLVLRNLGINAPVDFDSIIPINQDWLQQTGNVLTITFPAGALPDGVYQLEILPSAKDQAGNALDGNADGTAGDAHALTGTMGNGFWKLAGDFNGDTGVSALDLPTFQYWFGQTAGPAPAYVDLNHDGVVNLFDWPRFRGNFGRQIVFGAATHSAPVAQSAPTPQGAPVPGSSGASVQLLPRGLVTHDENGRRVLHLHRGQNVMVDAALSGGAADLLGFQINFAPSSLATGQITLSNWSPAGAWDVALDATLSAPPDSLVSSVRVAQTPLQSPVALGSLRLDAPQVVGQFLLSCANDGSSPLLSAFADGMGNGLNVDDWGDLLIVVHNSGDANDDGIVNADDYFRIDRGFVSQDGDWEDGDFNSDGRIDIDDYFLIDTAYSTQAKPLADQAAPIPILGPEAASRRANGEVAPEVFADVLIDAEQLVDLDLVTADVI